MQKKFFEENGYLLIKNLCNIEEFFSIEDIENHKKQEVGVYHYEKVEENLVVKKVEKYQENVENCSSRYKYPKYNNLHFLIKNYLEEILEKKLYPSFYYDRIYFKGNELKVHKDRPSCEVSVTLHISSNLNRYWPFFLKDYKNKKIQVNLNPGDAVLYHGTNISHWRYPLESKYNKFEQRFRKIFNLKDNTYYYQIFFHYVYMDGQYAHHAWDYPNQNDYANQNYELI